MNSKDVDEICKLTSSLVKIPSVSNDSARVAEAADFVKEWLGDNEIIHSYNEHVTTEQLKVAYDIYRDCPLNLRL